MRSRNYRAFLIHALFLSLTMSFIDVNTVAPAMLTESGASTFHLGLLTAIMVGFSSFMQLIFATYIVSLRYKRPALLTGIYLRVFSLASLGFFLLTPSGQSTWRVWMILLIMALFSFSGAFANIAYTDILGSTIERQERKRLLTVKQLISSIGLIVSSIVVKIVLSNLSYPNSYSLLFLMASGLLLIATSGFWMLKEGERPAKPRTKLTDRLKMYGIAIKNDKNIRLYLLLINTSGVILSTLPFLVVYANQNYGLDGGRTGTYLLLQLSGSLLATIFTNLFSKGQRYRPLLYIFIAMGAFTPILALILAPAQNLYPLVFLLGGATTALMQILSMGILLEISTDENRPIYTGIGGAGGLMNILYPILAGLLLPSLGFAMIFLLTSVFICVGLISAKQLNCSILTM